MKFKTTIKCAGCIAQATPFLDKAAGENNWSVDLQSPEKILTVDDENVSSSDIITAMKQAGYEATPVAGHS